jgi:hypothetical protein
MLLFLIPAIWATIVALVVILCRGAARADATMLTPSSPARPHSRLQTRGALTVFEEPRVSASASRGSRLRGERAFRVRGVRGRAGRCVAGS